jgi:outer membrane protein TolC
VKIPDSAEELDLIGLLDVALQNHPATKQAWELSRAQAYGVEAVRSEYYPSVDGSFIFNYVDRSGGSRSSNALPQNQTDGDASSQIINNAGDSSLSTTATTRTKTYIQSFVKEITISYLLLDFGGRRAAVESAKQVLNALNWNQNRVVQTLIVNVLQSYYAYIGAKELVVAKLEDLKNADAALEAAQVRFESGLATKLDVLQASASRENVLLGLATARGQVNIQLGALATALGVPPDSVIKTKELPEIFPSEQITTSVNELMEIAKTARPDLASAYASFLQSKEQVIAAYSAGMPTLTASSLLQRTNYPNQSFNNGHYYSATLALSGPIFDGFFYRNQFRQAQENALANKAYFEYQESLALLDVITSYYNFTTSQENLKYTEDYLKFAQQAYDLSLEFYRVGTGTFTDLLNSQALLSDARAQRIQARTGWATSLFNIGYATGTLNINFINYEMAGPETLCD